MDVSGTSGNIITYIGDVTGENTDSIGGLVRITGSNDDLEPTRSRGVDCPGDRNFRTWRGFKFDLITADGIELEGTDCIVEDCIFFNLGPSGDGVRTSGTSTLNHIIRRCIFLGYENGINFDSSTIITDTNLLIENCLFLPGLADSIRIDNTGDVLVKNCTFIGGGDDGVDVVVSAGTGAGEFTTVNDCVFSYFDGAVLEAATSGDIISNYNNSRAFSACIAKWQ